MTIGMSGKAIDKMTAVERELYGRALPEQEDFLHKHPREWREKLANMYRELCDEFQARKARSLMLGNIVARTEFESWKKEANKRKGVMVEKLQYVKGLIRDESEGTKDDYKERQLALLEDIRDELRTLNARELN
jgi:hypothetical protein